MNTNNRALCEAEKKLTMLLMEIKGTPTSERVKLYVAKMTGGKLLSAYLHDDGIPPKERAMLAETLTDILLKREYDRLPVMEIKGEAATVVEIDETPLADKAEALGMNVRLEDPDAKMRAAIRRELAGIFETLARVLRE